jgi:hypothetical protein
MASDVAVPRFTATVDLTISSYCCSIRSHRIGRAKVPAKFG